MPPWPPWLERILSLGFLIGIGVFVGGLAPKSAPSEFYATSAQVVPVFLLVLVLELRFFRLRSTNQQGQLDIAFLLFSFHQILIFGIFLVFIIAEFSSLSALATPNPHDGDPSIIYGALAIGAVLLLSYGVWGGTATAQRPSNEDADTPRNVPPDGR